MTNLLLQLLVVISADWNAAQGILYCYQRRVGKWELSGEPIPVALGKQGMAWGRGLYDLTDQTGLHKKEGDGRSPAGLFSIGTAFGDAFHREAAQKMPFFLITEDLEWVDDPLSTRYNQLVHVSSIEDPDWKSSEKMQEIGPLYALGLVIEHNLHPITPRMGSAIFMHIWRDKDSGTQGCTVMEESDLKRVVSWLNREHGPCLVQLPIEEYRKRQAEWDLPALP